MTDQTTCPKRCNASGKGESWHWFDVAKTTKGPPSAREGINLVPGLGGRYNAWKGLVLLQTKRTGIH